MKKKILAALLAAAMALAPAACGSSGGSASHKSTQKKAAKKEDVKKDIKKDEKKEYVKETDFSDLFADPDDYAGKYIKISGKVFNNPEIEGKHIAYQAWHDADNSTRDFLFYTDDDSIEIDDYVVVDGKIAGAFKGESAIGLTITCPKIKSASVKVQSYMEAVVPTVYEVAPEDAVSSQGGVTLSVDKVEFAESETRIYLTVSNASSDKFYIHDYNMRIIQNGRQIEQDASSDSLYSGDYPALSGTLLSNATSSGIVVFPAMDSSAGFQLHAEGASDNWDVKYEPFVIDVPTAE